MCSWHGRAAHLELDQAGESAQMKARDVGLVPLLCCCLPWVPGGPPSSSVPLPSISGAVQHTDFVQQLLHTALQAGCLGGYRCWWAGMEITSFR